MGWTLHLAGQETEAAQILQKALQQNPKLVPALNALGIVYLVSGDLSAAVQTHQQAVALDSNNEIAYYNLALAYQRLKQFDLALPPGQKAAKLEPHNPHTWIALALIYWDQGDRLKARQMYRRALNLDARYRQPDFLAQLKLAGLSPDQITLVRQIQRDSQ